GPHSFKFDVEFQGNVICHLTWDELNGTLEGLPTCRKTGIEIGPYETLIIYPSNWTDLIHAQVIVEGGSEDGDLTLPLIGIIGLVVVAAVVLWFFWRRKKEPL
ncbi:MAG: LPXTG cell wall anchor domain-containing protein, partial [Methanomassiliicoccales archaeon]|nr:LPXTG cell wall anchor domain-containing protein [Methanomassiliicoccales archaeon]